MVPIHSPARALLVAVVLTLTRSTLGDDSCPASKTFSVQSNNAKFSGSCQVYKRGESPIVCEGQTELSEGVGWGVVVGFGGFFTIFTMLISRYEYNTMGTEQTSEQFNTAGRDVGPGLTASVIVSQWTWAATLLMSSNMGWRVGLSGPFWYASGATIQILLFAVLAIQVKRRASHMHTFMEIIKARFGTVTHIIMICFALTTNVIVTSMLLLGGASTIEDLTGMSRLTAAFLIPILSCWLYTMYGGLRATFVASYVHTTVIFIMLITFTFAVYASEGEQDLWGSPANVHRALEKASVHGFFNSTFPESTFTATSGGATVDPSVITGCGSTTTATSYASKTAFFDGIGAIMQNDGICYTAQGKNTGKSCGFSERSKDQPCCNIDFTDVKAGTYCRSETTDCVSASADKHFESLDCNFAAGEKCVTSFTTMGSTIGLIFGITNIVGNFGTVFVDQAYWQSAVAAKPKSAVLGFLIGGMVWFAVPFCMATTTGLAGRALTMHTDINGQFGSYYIDGAASSAGLTPARVLSKLMGPFGAFMLLLQLFMAITSTGSAEIIAVSSILTYDVYYEYINPELKSRREKLRLIFYSVVNELMNRVGQADAAIANVALLQPDKEAEVRLGMAEKMISLASIQALVNALSSMQFFETQPSGSEIEKLSAIIGASAADGAISIPVLYSAVNKAVASNNIEGRILLRVSKFFTGIFALLMGFLAVFLLTLGLSLGHVYMSMGCLVGSAVGPCALTILMERANSKAISAGAIGGLILAIIGWTARAAHEFGEVTYETMMQDWPWVVGNLCAIIGGTVIALVGSLIWPDNDFKWAQLNDRIALVDDVEPPKNQKDESDEKLNFQVKIAIGASLVLTFVLLVLWPVPLHLAGGVFSEGGFTVWVMLQMIWAIVGGGVIVILPAIELYNTFRGKDQAVASADGVSLKITVDNAASPPAVAGLDVKAQVIAVGERMDI